AHLDVLKDFNPDDGETAVDVHDIVYVSNIATPNVNPADVFLNWNFKLGRPPTNVGAGIGFDVGIPGLRLETTGAVNLQVGWEFDFGFGINASDGFFLDVSSPSDLRLDVDVTTPGAGIKGTLGFLQLSAKDDTTDGDGLSTHLGATFGINIINRSNPSDPRLGFSELGRIGIVPGLAAEAVVDLDTQLSLSSDIVPGAATNFPKVVADFTLLWGVGNRAAGQLVPLDSLHGDFLQDGLKYVGFQNVGLDLGSYLSNV